MIAIITLLLLLFTVSISLGGGLYEVLVVYPNWKHNVDPQTLTDKLNSSGQNYAAQRFWPLVSPLQGVLAMINIWLAWNYKGEAYAYWLAASWLIFANRLFTFVYFIPAIIQISKPTLFKKADLQARVTRWTALSPLRLLPELAGWISLCIALMRF